MCSKGRDDLCVQTLYKVFLLVTSYLSSLIIAIPECLSLQVLNFGTFKVQIVTMSGCFVGKTIQRGLYNDYVELSSFRSSSEGGQGMFFTLAQCVTSSSVHTTEHSVNLNIFLQNDRSNLT